MTLKIKYSEVLISKNIFRALKSNCFFDLRVAACVTIMNVLNKGLYYWKKRVRAIGGFCIGLGIWIILKGNLRKFLN